MLRIISAFFILLFCLQPTQSFTGHESNSFLIAYERIMVKLVNELSESSHFTVAEQQLQSFMTRNRIKGLTVGVMKNGKLVYAKGFGYANEQTKENVEPYHNFRIASASKWVTALGIMKLYQEDKLDLDDYVFAEGGLLANEAFADVITDPNYKRIQVKHLLYHTAGWNTSSMGDPMFKPNYFAGRIKTDGEITQDDIFRYAIYYKLPYRPGAHYSYSNVGYAMLGRIISKLSGMSYETYIQSEILHPLGIYDMYLTSDKLESKKFYEVIHYDHQPGTQRQAAKGMDEMVSRVYEGTHFEALEGAGSWSANPADLLRLLAATDGDPSTPDILRKDVVDLMLKPVNPGNSFIGWKDVKEDTWIRTGTLIGTNALLVRLNEEYSYCIISNTSTWKGATVNSEFQALMSRFINLVEEWPEHNLFNFYELAPLQAISPKGFKPMSSQTF
jgi:CubicO group peptidase (beta-lactamase class C family)